MKILIVTCQLIIIAATIIIAQADSSVEVSSGGELNLLNDENDANLHDASAASTMNDTDAANAVQKPSEETTMTSPFSYLEDDDDDEEEDGFDDEDDFYDDNEDYVQPMISPYDDNELHDGDIDDASDFGVPQIYAYNYEDEIYVEIESARYYMEQKVWADDSMELVWDLCVNKDENCAHWSVLGECDANPSYMKTNCAPFCQSCEMMHVSTRCPKPSENATLAMYPGDLDRIMLRLLNDPEFTKYEPKALSRPEFADGDTLESADYALGMWVVVLENIVNEEEANHLIGLARKRGFERSADVGEELDDGTFGVDVNDDRTSTNAWCEDDCLKDQVAQKVMDTIEHVTGIPERNQEPLQQLFYEEGQFYRTHNDFIEYQVDREGGPRILTFFLYLNDVEEGGETQFPRINISVKPKLGRAVLWPSVYNHDPFQNDLRSDHQALPVIKGVKYGANAWIHQGNVKDDPLDCM
ncbi:hypothetical protein MPSEU_000016000 [Mayamaea pseudoterrestris]|nr:hypothetical protein MPSEU_000016000 [Mayamaea pseudoterrestris]